MKIALHNPKNKGFTLIEILVVISIIGILSGMLFTGASAAMNSARKADASNTAYNVRNAASAYFTEYRRHASPVTSSGDYEDFATDENYMDILLGAESSVGKEKNPRGIAFFSGKAAKKLSSNTYIKGIAMNKDGGGSLWDPFGRMYGVRLDTANKGRMQNPAVHEPSLSGGNGEPSWGSSKSVSNLPDIITESVAVWSSGKEEDIASDNVMTW